MTDRSGGPGEGGGARAVFLDRDGVLNRARAIDRKPYAARSLDELEILPGVPEACAALKSAGFALVVVTNQPEIARGTLPRAVAEAMNRFLQERLALDEVAMCPHDDRDACPCRKPKPGLLLEVARRRGLDLSRCVMVGDRWRDVEAGRAAGCATVFVDLGWDERRPTADHSASSLPDAVPWILGTGRP